MKRTFSALGATFLTVSLALMPMSVAADSAPPELPILGDEQNGWLWTASFQRADGSTCTWIEVTDGQMTAVLYDRDGGFCRAVPPEDAARFEFQAVNGDMVQFGGPDFTIVNNTASQISGDWNHISLDSRFDLSNVVFRWMPAL